MALIISLIPRLRSGIYSQIADRPRNRSEDYRHLFMSLVGGTTIEVIFLIKENQTIEIARLPAAFRQALLRRPRNDGNRLFIVDSTIEQLNCEMKKEFQY